jgi:superfamily II DNA or RNA helicase
MSDLRRHNLVRWPGGDNSPVGVVSAVEGGRVSVRFDDGHERTFAADGEALERVALERGTPVVMPATGDTGTVSAVLENKGIRFYELTTAAGASQHVPESAVRPLVLSDPVERLRAGQLDSARSVNLRLAAVRLRYAYEQDELSSLHASRVEIKPHQVGVVHRVTATYPHRFILADEVGLGKTIEAGLIIRELKARGVARRVLILAPSGLVTQWQTELKDKFNQVFADYRGPLVRALQAQNPQENVWALSDNVVSSTTFAAWDDTRAREIAATGWDLVVVDEAHHARRTRHGDRLERTRLYRLLELVMDPEQGNASSALFLTATPMQLDPFESYSLIELLDPTLFSSPADFEENRRQLSGLNRAVEALKNWPALDGDEREEAVEILGRLLEQNTVDVLAGPLSDDAARRSLGDELASRHRLSQVLIRNRKKNVTGFKPRVAAIWELDLTPEERLAYDALTKYAREGFERSQEKRQLALGFVMVMFQKLATSSSVALRRALLRRAEKLEAKLPGPDAVSVELDDDEPEESFDSAVEDLGEDALSAYAAADEDEEAIWHEVQAIESIVVLLDQISMDSKTKMLIDQIEQIRDKEPDPRILIFTQFRGTQDMLAETLPEPWSVHLFHGGLDPRQKDLAVADFRDESGPQILISTEAGGEGRNLQFCHYLINYDLPWNPMRVEQRIGRVDRIGQRHEFVLVASFSTRDTVEERVVEVLSQRINVFEETIGGLDPILGDVERDLRRLFLHAEREADRARKRLEASLEQRVRDARDAEEKLRDLIMDERSLLREDVDRLLSRSRTTTEDDLRRFSLQALDELGAVTEFHAAVRDTYDLELRGQARDTFPQLYREGPRRHVTFDRQVAQDHDEVEFLAFGHELVDGLVARVCASDYPARSSARVVQTDQVPPMAGWFFVYAIELDGVIRRRELYPVFASLEGEPDGQVAQSLLKVATELHREEGFVPGAPLELPADRASLDTAQSRARATALGRMVELQDELEGPNEERLEAERTKLQRFYEYKQAAAERKLADTQRVFDRVSTSDDPEVLRIVPVWAGNLERARRDRDGLAADFARRLSELEVRSTVGTRMQLLTASYVEVEPDHGPLRHAIGRGLPKEIADTFFESWGRPSGESLGAIRLKVSERRRQLKALAKKHSFDNQRADVVGARLEALLADVDGAPQRAALFAAAQYYLRLADAVRDVRSPDGFKDDELVLNAVEAAIARADG